MMLMIIISVFIGVLDERIQIFLPQGHLPFISIKCVHIYGRLKENFEMIDKVMTGFREFSAFSENTEATCRQY